MKQLLIILSLSILLFGCGDSHQQQPEKADRLTQQAFEEMNRQNYEEAEHLLAECIDIHSRTNNEAKLAENYSTLSSVQLLSGKLSSCLETLSALRTIFQHGADRNAELQTMLQMGNIYSRLGRVDDAAAIMGEVYNDSKLFRLDQAAISAAMELSKMFSKIGMHEKALLYSVEAVRAYKSQHNMSGVAEALSLEIASYVGVGKTDKAFSLFREGDSLLTSDRSISAVKFYVECGKAFSRVEEWMFAKQKFEHAISLMDSMQTLDHTSLLIQATIGIGEIYFHHFAFAEAQQSFVRAYHLSKDRPDGIIESYLLIRVADCLMKRSAYDYSRDGFIHAAQLYEQAQTLFARNGFSFGEAIALHRLGMVKEMTLDEYAAITFYKRAFDKFVEYSVPLELYSLPIDINPLIRSGMGDWSPVEWFSQNLISLLLKTKHIDEAFSYLQCARSVALQLMLPRTGLQFKEPKRNARFTEFHNASMMLQMNILELHSLTMMRQQTANKNYSNKLQQQLLYTRSRVQSDAVTLAQEFPVFSFLTASPRSVPISVINSIPPGTTLLDFVITGNDAWVFKARTGEELTAVKLSSYGFALEKKMDRFCELLSSPVTQNDEIQMLSRDLYDLLIKPIDLNGSQYIIIIPPFRHEQFPFHALGERENTLLDKISVTYIPHSSFVLSTAKLPKFLNSITAFGYTTNTRWGLEFELRDIRSFFRNTQVNINQSATYERLSASVGEVLQISSQYSIDTDRQSWFTLSGGSTSKAGLNIPINRFTELYPYPIVYLSDVQSNVSHISLLHPLLWLLSGSASVVTTQFPITSNISKSFGENFYSSLSMENNPFLAYRKATVQLERRKELNGGNSSAVYFYYGLK